MCLAGLIILQTLTSSFTMNTDQRSSPESVENSFTARPVTVHQNNSKDTLSTVKEFFAFSSIVLISELRLFLKKVT